MEWDKLRGGTGRFFAVIVDGLFEPCFEEAVRFAFVLRLQDVECRISRAGFQAVDGDESDEIGGIGEESLEFFGGVVGCDGGVGADCLDQDEEMFDVFRVSEDIFEGFAILWGAEIGKCLNGAHAHGEEDRFVGVDFQQEGFGLSADGEEVVAGGKIAVSVKEEGDFFLVVKFSIDDGSSSCAHGRRWIGRGSVVVGSVIVRCILRICRCRCGFMIGEGGIVLGIVLSD